MLPIWAQRDPQKYSKRIIWENESLKKYFPSFGMYQENDTTLFVKGELLTNTYNLYSVKVIYPDRYPFEPPIPFVIDNDVVEHCKKNSSHRYHHRGFQNIDGVNICAIKPDDTVGMGWKPEFSVITMIMLVSKWLHAYEVKKETGVWIFPEA